MGRIEGTHTHEAVVGQDWEGLALVALDRDARRVDEAEGVVGESGHVCKAIDGVVGADLGDI